MSPSERRFKSCGKKRVYLSFEAAQERANWVNKHKPGDKKRKPYKCYNRRSDLPDDAEFHWHIGRRGCRTVAASAKKGRRFGGKRARYTTRAA